MKKPIRNLLVWVLMVFQAVLPSCGGNSDEEVTGIPTEIEEYTPPPELELRNQEDGSFLWVDPACANGWTRQVLFDNGTRGEIVVVFSRESRIRIPPGKHVVAEMKSAHLRFDIIDEVDGSINTFKIPDPPDGSRSGTPLFIYNHGAAWDYCIKSKKYSNIPMFDDGGPSSRYIENMVFFLAESIDYILKPAPSSIQIAVFINQPFAVATKRELSHAQEAPHDARKVHLIKDSEGVSGFIIDLGPGETSFQSIYSPPKSVQCKVFVDNIRNQEMQLMVAGNEILTIPPKKYWCIVLGEGEHELSAKFSDNDRTENIVVDLSEGRPYVWACGGERVYYVQYANYNRFVWEGPADDRSSLRLRGMRFFRCPADIVFETFPENCRKFKRVYSGVISRLARDRVADTRNQIQKDIGSLMATARKEIDERFLEEIISINDANNSGHIDECDLLMLQAVIEYAREEDDACREMCEMILKCRDECALPHFLLGKILLRKSKKDEATKEFEAAEKLNPKFGAFVDVRINNTKEKAGKPDHVANMPEKSSREKIANINPKSCMTNSIVVSSDNRHVAYLSRVAGKLVVVSDGRQGKTFDNIGLGSLKYNTDGSRLAYSAKQGGKWVLVVDGVAGNPFDIIMEGAPVFNKEGGRIAYGAMTGQKWVMVVDGKPEGEYDGILKGSQIFSPDGKRVGYGVLEGKKWVMIVDGKSIGEHDGILEGSPVFSPDGKRVAYGAMEGNRWIMVIDGKPEGNYDGILQGSPVFSPDGDRVAYGAMKGKKWTMVIDGKPEGNYDNILEGSPVFSSDGKRMAYGAMEGKRWFMVVDGEKGKPYDGIAANSFRFMRNGEGAAYIGFQGKKAFIVQDGKEGKAYEGIQVGSPVLSPGGDKIAYVAAIGKKRAVVFEGREGKKYDSIRRIQFGPNGKRLAFFARAERKVFVVVDGEEGEKFDDVICAGNGRVVFDSPDRIHYLALKGRDILLVEEKLKLAEREPGSLPRRFVGKWTEEGGDVVLDLEMDGTGSYFLRMQKDGRRSVKAGNLTWKATESGIAFCTKSFGEGTGDSEGPDVLVVFLGGKRRVLQRQ